MGRRSSLSSTTSKRGNAEFECARLPNRTVHPRQLNTRHDQLPPADMANKEDEEKNAYEIVGVGADATDTDIKKAFRQRSLKTHPDRVRLSTARP